MGEENTVKVEGLVRVGHLAKGLLLANDKSFSIILLCISPPTKSMLQQFHLKLRSRIKECDTNMTPCYWRKRRPLPSPNPMPARIQCSAMSHSHPRRCEAKTKLSQSKVKKTKRKSK